jgi:hypothetical protein
MPRTNRVQPDGSMSASGARGLFTGNRGVLHDAEGRLVRRWTTRAWICCRLEWRGRRRPLMTPGRWTELFFLDEAAALAAGHRPCAACRHGDYRRFQALWPGSPPAPAMDRALHAARLGPRPSSDPQALPDGSFVCHPEGPALVLAGRLLRYSPEGYTGRLVPVGPLPVLTPAPISAVLAAGYRPVIHPSAFAS